MYHHNPATEISSPTDNHIGLDGCIPQALINIVMKASRINCGFYLITTNEQNPLYQSLCLPAPTSSFIFVQATAIMQPLRGHTNARLPASNSSQIHEDYLYWYCPNRSSLERNLFKERITTMLIFGVFAAVGQSYNWSGNGSL